MDFDSVGTLSAFQFEDLSPELQEKVCACKTSEELFELAKSEGVELSEEELEAINGGMASGWSIPGCPKFDGHTKRVNLDDASLNAVSLSGRGLLTMMSRICF